MQDPELGFYGDRFWWMDGAMRRGAIGGGEEKRAAIIRKKMPRFVRGLCEVCWTDKI